MGSESGGSLEDRDAQVKQATCEQHSQELRRVEELLTACLRGFTSLGSFTPGQDNRVQHAQLLLVTRSFNSVRCAYDLLRMGYYTQALTLIRSAMEDDLTALDCEKLGATVEAILDGKGAMGKGKLTYTEMAKRQSEKFQTAWKHNYGGLSEYAAHARRKSLRVLVDPETHELRLGGRYDRDLFIGTFDALLSALIRSADLIARVLGQKAPPWQKETYPMLKAAKEWRGMIKSKLEKEEQV